MGQFYVNGDGVTTMATSDGNQITISAMGGGGGWVLLESQTAASSATLDFTTGFGSHSVYVFVANRIIPETDPDALELQISIDGGSTWITTNYSAGNIYWVPGSGTWGDSGSSGASLCIVPGWSGPQGISLTTYISSETGQNPYLWGTGFYNGVAINLQGQNTTTTVVNGFRWLCSSGNILSGTFSLYGIQQ